MTTSHDRTFFDTFMLILGGLVLFTALIFVISRVIAGRTQADYIKSDPLVQQRLDERLEPIGRVAIAGQDNSDLAPSSPPASQTTATAPAAMLSGEQVYNSACIACHGAGVAGAPKLGDAAAWAARTGQGADILYGHAINGFQGNAGYMPPKGGRIDLSDEQVRAAVDYMVDEAS